MKYDNWVFGKDGAFLSAAAKGRLELVKELYGLGADINTTSPNGFTALHRAAQNGHLEVVKFLLKHGAKLKAQASDKSTPLSLAQDNKHSDIAEFLQERK